MAKTTITKKDAITVAKHMKRFNNYWDAIRPRLDEFKDYYKTYRFYRDETTHPYKYNVHKPMIFTHVQNLISGVLNTIWEKPSIADVMPTEGRHITAPQIIDEVIAKQAQKVLNNTINNADLHWYEEMMDIFTEMSIYGQGFSRLTAQWDGDTYIGPRLECASNFDVIPNNTKYRLDPTTDLFYKETISFDELEKRKEFGYKNIDLLKTDNYMTDDLRKEMAQDIGKDIIGSGGVDRKNNRILLLHYFDGLHITTIGGNRVVVRDTKDPIDVTIDGETVKQVFPPFPYYIWDMVKINPVPKELYGIGITEIAKTYQELANIRASQRNENIELVLDKPIMVNPLFDIDVENLFTGPGNIIFSNDINNSMKFLETTDITSSSWREDQLDKLEAEDATSITDIVRGAAGVRRETATDKVIRSKAGAKRSQTILFSISKGFLKSILKKSLIQIRAFMPQKQYERILGEPDAGFYLLSTDEIARNYDIQPSISGIDANREQEQATFIQAWQILVQQPFINQEELAKYYFELFRPEQNPERFILRQDQQQQQQQQQQQAIADGQGQQQQGQQQGQGQPVAPPNRPTNQNPTFSNDQIIELAGRGQLGGSI